VATLAGKGNNTKVIGTLRDAKFSSLAGHGIISSKKYYISANYRIYVINNGLLSIAAGTGALGYKDGPALSGEFYYPTDMVGNASGELFISDRDNGCIRLLKNNQLSTYVGSLSGPRGLAIDNSGRIYVSETSGNRIKEIISGKATVKAGSGVAGYFDGSAVASKFNAPTGVDVNGSGTIYVADSKNKRIRLIKSNTVSTLVSTSSPVADVALGFDGYLYYTSSGNHSLMKVDLSSGKKTTVVGNGYGSADGPSSTAQLAYPSWISLLEKKKLIVSSNGLLRIVYMK